MNTITVRKTIKCKLLIDANQRNLLLDTIQEYTDAYNIAVLKAIEVETSNKVELHHCIYNELRNSTRLPADYVISLISVAYESYKSWKTWCKKKGKLCNVPTSKFQSPRLAPKNLYSISKDLKQFSISTLQGRIKVKFECRQGMNIPNEFKLCASTLVYDKKHDRFFLHLVISYEKELSNQINILSADMGVQYQVVTYDTNSNNFEIFHDGNLLEIDQHYIKIRKDLQSKDTRSSKRRMKAIGSRQSRLRREIDHLLSKSLIEYCQQQNVNTIIVEDLTNIRKIASKNNKSCNYNRKMNMWAFFRLQSFIEYKANDVGITMKKVNPAYTSITCPTCNSVDKANRPDRNTFKCIDCGMIAFSDYVAAYNIYRVGIAI